MKRSDFFIRLTTGVLFLAVAFYIGVKIYNSIMNTYVTTVAISYDFEETFPAQGYIVRSETVITDGGDAVMPTVNDGVRVAAGRAVAVEYTNREALETASEIHELRMRISKLEASGEVIEDMRRDSVIALSLAVQNGDLSMLDELSLDIESYIFTDASKTAAELPALQARLETLERRNEGVRTVYAPASGIFTHVIDGFEHIGPGDLAEITPDELTDMFSSPSVAHGAGKLVTDFRWYYVVVMNGEDAVRLPLGRHITVQFSGAYNESSQMLVESIGRREEGLCVVLFSSDRSVHDIVSLRGIRADIIFSVVSGIRVPKEALHLDDDGTVFIYLQTGVRAERVNVEILHEAGDSYIVRDGAATGSPLRSGTTIIVRANGLFDGKIVA